MRVDKYFISIVLISFIFCTGLLSQLAAESNPKITKIAEGFNFTEGPVWKPGAGLLFSDIPANKIYSWHPQKGKAIYLENSGNSNGLAIDSKKRLLLAQHGKRRLVRLDQKANQTILAERYHGKRLNSPNDITIKSNGTIFFTDPPYGINKQQEELGFYGIYSLTPSGQLHLLDNSLKRPNGIELAPDESKIYVTDSGENQIYSWNLVNDSTLTNKDLLTAIDTTGKGGTDGLKINDKGTLFVAGPVGIWLIDPAGEILDTIAIPGQTTNCAWQGTNQNILYVTSQNAIYQIDFSPAKSKLDKN